MVALPEKKSLKIMSILSLKTFNISTKNKHIHSLTEIDTSNYLEFTLSQALFWE